MTKINEATTEWLTDFIETFLLVRSDVSEELGEMFVEDERRNSNKGFMVLKIPEIAPKLELDM